MVKLVMSLKVVRLLVAILVAGAAFSFLPTAVAKAYTPDWISQDANLVSREKISGLPGGKIASHNICTERQVAYVDPQLSGSSRLSNMCVTEGDGFSLGAEIESGGWIRTLAISIGNDSRFYKFTHPGFGGGITLTLIPNTKEFIIAQSAIDKSRHLRFYGDLISSLTRLQDGSYGLEEHSDRLLNTIDYVYGWGVSENGRFVVYGKSPRTSRYNTKDNLFIFDKETGSHRMFGVSPYVFLAYPYSPPHIAVSNDGKQVFATGNSTLKFWSINEECMSQYDDGVPLYATDKCPHRHYLPDFYEPTSNQYANSQNLHLSEDYSELLYAHNHTTDGSYELVRLRASNINASKKINYLAMGDSYSSGEGDVGGSYYVSDTEKPGYCHLSSRSYPYLLRAHWGLQVNSMYSVACSGARVAHDYISRLDSYDGQGGKLAGLTAGEKKTQQTHAIDGFKPGIVPQIEFVKKYKPKIVTLTAGGNDVGFSNILEYCASPSWEERIINVSCSYAVDERAKEMLKNSIHSQYGMTRLLISKIKDASPETKIYLVGYPQFIAGPSIGCMYNAASLNLAERKMIRQAVSELNNVLWRAATDEGVVFIDVEDSLQGGQLCEGGQYMTGLLNIGMDNIVNNRIHESFHPNHKGHARMASDISGKIGIFDDLTQGDLRQADSGEYYSMSTPTKVLQMVDNVVYLGGFMNISLPSNSLKPGSEVRATIFYEPVDLGSYQIDRDGSLSVSVDLIDEVDPGQHVLVLEGESYSGEKIAFYQFITIGSKRGDIDGDGIPDSRDRCNFIESWIDESTGKDVCVASASFNGSRGKKTGVSTINTNNSAAVYGEPFQSEQLASTGHDSTDALSAGFFTMLLSLLILSRVNVNIGNYKNKS